MEFIIKLFSSKEETRYRKPLDPKEIQILVKYFITQVTTLTEILQTNNLKPSVNRYYQENLKLCRKIIMELSAKEKQPIDNAQKYLMEQLNTLLIAKNYDKDDELIAFLLTLLHYINPPLENKYFNKFIHQGFRLKVN